MDTLFENGAVLTLENGARTAEALLVRDGRIVLAGTREEAGQLAGTGARRVDLQGHTLLPAFIDPHGHFSAAANALLQVPLDECVTLEEIAGRLREHIRAQRPEPGAWIIVKGYDHNALREKRHPDRALLDAAAPDNPVMLQHRSGHMGVFNTRGLERLGVTADTPAPSGGRIGLQDGRLTGYMEENAFLEAQKQVPMPSVEALLDAYRRVQDQYASHGIATVQEGMLPTQLIPLYQALLQAGLLRLDVVGYPDAASAAAVKAAFPEHLRRYKDRFKIGGYKMFLDGSPQGRTAWMRRPYEGGGDYTGYGTLTDNQVEDVLRQAVRDGMQPLAHGNGDAACAQFLRAVQAVGPAASALRPVLIHAQLLGTDQLPAVKRLGVTPSFFVAHVYYWGDTHLENFGRARASAISPARSAEKLGIRFTFHQDTPVIPPDMLETVWCAVNRRTKAGVLLGEEERVDTLTALRAVTANAAWQYGEEGEKGTLAPGKRADLTVLDRNPLQTPPEALRDIRVLETYKDGVCIYRRKS